MQMVYGGMRLCAQLAPGQLSLAQWHMHVLVHVSKQAATLGCDLV